MSGFEKLPKSVKKIISTIENCGFSVMPYDEDGVVCGAEIEDWTSGGVDMIHFIDLRDKNIRKPDDWKNEISSIVCDFDVDYEVDIHRQDKRYRDAFTCAQSVHDFEEWQERLRELAQTVLYPELQKCQ
ncbi:hypothetical protein SDC9_52627 [bioreactor metagenome]|uniref:Uncharacterized protein n=1 Tax=bioreactor metagenome TaxID=1076179 RepID=A0A644WS84_9ZZZZ